METGKLNEKAMIAYVSISQWNAKKISDKATAELCATHSTTSKWTKGQKSLVSEEEIAKIQKAANKIRTFHNDNTLSWDRNGGGLLPNTNYLDYTRQLNALISDFDQAVDTFVAAYPTLQAEAAQHLNGLYNAADYPDAAHIRSRFGVNVTFLPVPDSSDFRVSLQDGEAEKIRQGIEQYTRDQLSGAVQDLWERLQTAVRNVKTKLSDKDSIFRDSLIENIKDICKLIPKLNVTNDPNLDTIAAEAMKSLTVSPNLLRDNESVRSTTAKAASDILSKMSAYCGGN